MTTKSELEALAEEQSIQESDPQEPLLPTNDGRLPEREPAAEEDADGMKLLKSIASKMRNWEYADLPKWFPQVKDFESAVASTAAELSRLKGRQMYADLGEMVYGILGSMIDEADASDGPKELALNSFIAVWERQKAQLARLKEKAVGHEKMRMIAVETMEKQFREIDRLTAENGRLRERLSLEAADHDATGMHYDRLRKAASEMLDCLDNAPEEMSTSELRTALAAYRELMGDKSDGS